METRLISRVEDQRPGISVRIVESMFGHGDDRTSRLVVGKVAWPTVH